MDNITIRLPPRVTSNVIAIRIVKIKAKVVSVRVTRALRLIQLHLKLYILLLEVVECNTLYA